MLGSLSSRLCLSLGGGEEASSKKQSERKGRVRWRLYLFPTPSPTITVSALHPSTEDPNSYPKKCPPHRAVSAPPPPFLCSLSHSGFQQSTAPFLPLGTRMGMTSHCDLPQGITPAFLTCPFSCPFIKRPFLLVSPQVLQSDCSTCFLLRLSLKTFKESQ